VDPNDITLKGRKFVDEKPLRIIHLKTRLVKYLDIYLTADSYSDKIGEMANSSSPFSHPHFLDKIEQNCHKSEEKCAKMTK
jgi:hypothetical protein